VTLPVGDARHVLFVVIVLVGCVLVTAAWVHSDARAHAQRGRPIVSTIGFLELKTPVGWFFACLLIPELVLPIYMDSRSIA
jgi:hypothetical protein